MGNNILWNEGRHLVSGWDWGLERDVTASGGYPGYQTSSIISIPIGRTTKLRPKCKVERCQSLTGNLNNRLYWAKHGMKVIFTKTTITVCGESMMLGDSFSLYNIIIFFMMTVLMCGLVSEWVSTEHTLGWVCARDGEAGLALWLEDHIKGQTLDRFCCMVGERGISIE